MAGTLNPNSLERIIPAEISSSSGVTADETLKLHLERYQFARQRLRPGSLVDIACGVGYGTALMCSENASITAARGVDISAEAVEYARAHYGDEHIHFTVADAMTFRGDRPFDNVVSLETIEHVHDPERLFAHLVSLLAPGGRLVASVPATPSVDANPHHCTNFTRSGFLRMADRHPLRYIDAFEQVQPFSPVALAAKTEPRAQGLRKNLALFYMRNPSHLGLRIWSTLRYGFVNRYITVVWERR